MATKAELEIENKKLKSIIRELRKEVKNGEDSVDGLENKAFGIVDKKFVVINFDLEKNSAVIGEISEDHPTEIVAEYKMQQKSY